MFDTDKAPELTAQDEAFLARNPWVATLYHDSSTAVPFVTGHRLSDPSIQRDRLFSSTLRDSGAVSTTLSWRAHYDFASVDAAVAADDKANAGQGVGEGEAAADKDGDMYLIPSVTLAFDLGKGVRGFQGVTHGGMFAVLIDECVGNFLALNKAATVKAQHGGFPRGSIRDGRAGEDGGKRLSGRLAGRGDVTAFTVGMDVKFKKPIMVPGVVVVRSWLGSITGRKIVVKSVIEGEGGSLYGSCDSTWLAVPASQAKL